MTNFYVGMSREKATDYAMFDKVDSFDGKKDGKLSSVDVSLYEKRILGKHSKNEKTIFSLGYTVAEKLIGNTDNLDQHFVTNFIKESVNENNIEAFLNGYDSNNWIDAFIIYNGDGIFEQLRTEYKYKEKNEVIRDLATKLMTYLHNIGQENDAKNLEQLINNQTFSKSDVKIMDDIVKNINKKHTVNGQDEEGRYRSTCKDLVGKPGKYFDYTM